MKKGLKQKKSKFQMYQLVFNYSGFKIQILVKKK